MAPVQCKIRFSVGTAKVSIEGERELTAGGGVTLVMCTPTPGQGQREMGDDVMGKLGENPAYPLALRLNERPHCCF